MSICYLQPAGEEVKAKNEKQLTRTRAQRAQRESLTPFDSITDKRNLHPHDA